jgi:hypothetical protein
MYRRLYNLFWFKVVANWGLAIWIAAAALVVIAVKI